MPTTNAGFILTLSAGQQAMRSWAQWPSPHLDPRSALCCRRLRADMLPRAVKHRVLVRARLRGHFGAVEKPDVFVAEHGAVFDLEAKAESARVLATGSGQVGGPNPFVDAAGYQRFVERSEQTYLKQLRSEQGKQR